MTPLYLQYILFVSFVLLPQPETKTHVLRGGKSSGSGFLQDRRTFSIRGLQTLIPITPIPFTQDKMGIVPFKFPDFYTATLKFSPQRAQ